MSQNMASDQVLHCLPMCHKTDARLKWVKHYQVQRQSNENSMKETDVQNFRTLAYSTRMDPEMGQEVPTPPPPPPPPPPEKSQSYIVLSNTGPDPRKITKLPSQHAIFSHYRPTREMAFPWRADDGPLLVVFGSSLPSTKNKTKTLSELNWTPSDKTFLIHSYSIQHYKSIQQNRS